MPFARFDPMPKGKDLEAKGRARAGGFSKQLEAFVGGEDNSLKASVSTPDAAREDDKGGDQVRLLPARPTSKRKSHAKPADVD